MHAVRRSVLTTLRSRNSGLFRHSGILNTHFDQDINVRYKSSSVTAATDIIDAYRGPAVASAEELETLRRLEQKLIWLSTYTIHHANNIRPKRDGLKVGGHQASSTSLSTIMTALYYKYLQPHDRVAVKPHAGPLFHAIQYMNGRQTKENLENFRAFRGVQSYPSRTKDVADVDFSTGSVGLGAAVTMFTSLMQDYLTMKGLPPLLEQGRSRPGRTIAIVGDAELDEGNVYEALLEGWKYGMNNNWWIIDFNRQSLDKVAEEDSFKQVDRSFRAHGYDVITLKYGKQLQEAFKREGGRALRRWINSCDNRTYSALCFQGGKAFRKRIAKDLVGAPGVEQLLAGYSDDDLYALMTNLGGTCMQTVMEAFEHANTDRPTCFIAYTVKGFGLPVAGHQDNHGLFLNAKQVSQLQTAHGVPQGQEWERFSGVCANDSEASQLQAFIDSAPFNERAPDGSLLQRDLTAAAPPLPVPAIDTTVAPNTSTQAHFGQVMLDLGKSDTDMADRIITMAPDVATSTNLSGFLNQRGVWRKAEGPAVAKENKVFSVNKWATSGAGQHFELGIAESNLMLALAAAGLSHSLHGRRLLPVGTLYDPFISRGLDALNYGCYMNSRFMLVATPSGITLAPEGGAHQSLYTPMIGMAQPGLTSMEPAYADELSVMMQWGFEHMQAPDGGAVYLRLSTRSLDQPERVLTPEEKSDILKGAYWRGAAADSSTPLVVVVCGALAPEAEQAVQRLQKRHPGTRLLQVTSPDVLHNDWSAREGASHVLHEHWNSGVSGGASHIAQLLAPLSRDAMLVTVVDAHPATLSWMGAVRGHKVKALGVSAFGQSGDLIDLYRYYGVDADAIVTAGHSMLWV